MDYNKAIEIYLNRTFNEEETFINVYPDETVKIAYWNILYVLQPTIQQLEQIYNDNKAEIEAKELQKKYKAEIERKVALKYSFSDEIAIQRKHQDLITLKLTDTSNFTENGLLEHNSKITLLDNGEFEAYNTEVERIKAEVKAEFNL